MTGKSRQTKNPRMPAGFTPRSSGLAGEYAREQGWGLNEEERKKTPASKQNFDGGTDYDYGARDFGDSAVDTSKERQPSSRSSTERSPASKQNSTGRS